METFSQQIFAILITPPGNLVYHLILTFSVVAGLQAAFIARRNNPDAVPTRLLVGLGILLLAQLVLFASSGLAWQQVADPQRFQPPLDRAVTAFSVVWIIWLWCFPTPSRAGDAVTVILSLVVIILGMFTINSWMLEDPSLAFNGTWYDWGWQIFCLALTFLGLLVLIIGRPPAWGTGVAVLGLILAGYVANLLLQPQGYFSGIVRLSQLCAFPLLPVLAHRLVQPSAAVSILDDEERHPYEPHLVFAWLQAAAETEPHLLSAALARAVGQTMLADLCFLLSAPDTRGRWVLMGGRDLVSDRDLPETALDPERIPNLAAALQRGRSIRLPQSGQPEPIDLKELGQTFYQDEANSLLAAPLINDGKVTGGIVLLSRYMDRVWTGDEQSQLMSIAEGLVPILQRAKSAAVPLPGKTENDDLRRENALLVNEVANLRAAALPVSNESDMDALMAVQKESQDTILQLQAELESLRAAKNAPMEEAQAINELRMALEDNAYLRNDLAAAEARIDVLRRATRNGTNTNESSGLITAIAQELRQPMSLLASYTEMLLAEAGGTLDGTQLGYLDRIKSSADRMRSMLDDLTRAANLQSGAPLDTQPVDLGAIIDSAVGAETSLMREKKINFRVDMPETLASFTGNEDALRQIVVDLLRNAVSVTPEGGTVMLRVRVEENGGGPNLQLQVRDSGGGIAPGAQDDIFQVKPASGAAATAGVADGGFGLAIAQALVKASGGKIWVESEAGKTTTYHVSVPSARSAQPGSNRETA